MQMRMGDMFLLYFYGLQIVAGVQSLGIWELEMMKNWTEAQIERHQGLILIGTRKHALSVAPNDKHYYCALEPHCHCSFKQLPSLPKNVMSCNTPTTFCLFHDQLIKYIYWRELAWKNCSWIIIIIIGVL